MITDIIFLVLVLLIFMFLLLAFLSPFESLGWWAGWSKRHLDPDESIIPENYAEEVLEAKDARFFIVYFTGIIALGDGAGGRREVAQLKNIASRLPAEAVMVHDVFPYSSSNNPLTGERQFSKYWQKLDESRRSYKSWINPSSLTVIVRNLLQYAVSADRRYGPLNNVGVAREMARSLLKHGYPANSGLPIYLIGYSGGGQIAVGSARYLHKAFDAPIRVIGWGGVYSDDPAIKHVDQLVRIQGSKDPVPWLGKLFFPGRWPIVPHSAWNVAKRNGRIQHINPGPLVHFGKHDYFSRHAKTEDGTPFADHVAQLTVDAILKIEGESEKVKGESDE